MKRSTLIVPIAAAILFSPAAFAQPGGGPPGGGPPGGGPPGGPPSGGPPGASGDQVVKFDQRNFQVWESSGEAVVSIDRFKGSEGEISVSWRIVGGTATPEVDFEPVEGTVTWTDGDTSRKTFVIPILDDSEFEVMETIELELFDPSEGIGLHPGHRQAVVMILDAREDNPGQTGDLDDSPGEIRFHSEEFQGVEGDTATVRVARVGGRVGAASVSFSTADGSAVAGEDYLAASGTLAWADGETGVKTFSVELLEDDDEEGNEQALLALSDPTGGATLDEEAANAFLTILDNDGSTAECVEDAETLCLVKGRFQVQATYRTSQGTSGAGEADEISDSTGLFWFFQEDNKEILVKVIDACVEPFDAYWVFFAATTDVGFTLIVTDTATGLVKEYTNLAGDAAEPVQDTLTFATCDG